MASLSDHYRSYLVFLNISFLLAVCTVFLITNQSSSSHFLVHNNSLNTRNDQPGCKYLVNLNTNEEKCLYVKSENSCFSEGYINYLYIFYCHFGEIPFLGYFLMFSWLLVLFYLLGNTASEYFCSSLENLSKLLKLSPTIAGVTLLSLGNGAPDVFASLVSFVGNETNDVGFNTVLGGASFVSFVVVGIISILVRRKRIRVNKRAFIRDVSFLLIVLAALIMILTVGEVNIWSSFGFLLVYIVYVVIVYFSDVYWKKMDQESNDRNPDLQDLKVPILDSIEKGEASFAEENCFDCGVGSEIKKCCSCLRPSASCCLLLRIIELPLYLPRRLTIPVVCETKWSKPIAVISVTVAPILLSILWTLQFNIESFSSKLKIYGFGFLIGVTFGILAYATTEKSNPPKKFLFPWLAGGFIMSVTWSYITAQELVALLVSFGYIFGISTAILALTVLAWGNSLGDLITNLTMALNGGPEGAQVAISGCYAGPIFNILFGLGLSLIGSSWNQYPSSVLVPKDPYLLETLGFLAGGLIWALLVLPRRDMKLDVVLGVGLLVVYFTGVSLRLVQTLGSLQFQTTSYSN